MASGIAIRGVKPVHVMAARNIVRSTSGSLVYEYSTTYKTETVKKTITVTLYTPASLVPADPTVYSTSVPGYTPTAVASSSSSPATATVSPASTSGTASVTPASTSGTASVTPAPTPTSP